MHCRQSRILTVPLPYRQAIQQNLMAKSADQPNHDDKHIMASDTVPSAATRNFMSSMFLLTLSMPAAFLMSILFAETPMAIVSAIPLSVPSLCIRYMNATLLNCHSVRSLRSISRNLLNRFLLILHVPLAASKTVGNMSSK